MTTLTRQSSDTLLRYAIRIDGIVVALLGIGMAATAGWLSTHSGLPVAAEYAIGVLCIAYGPLAFFLAARPHVRTIGLTLAAVNLGTTVAMIALALTGLIPTATGVALGLAVGAYTAVIGAVQYVGARRV